MSHSGTAFPLWLLGLACAELEAGDIPSALNRVYAIVEEPFTAALSLPRRHRGPPCRAGGAARGAPLPRPNPARSGIKSVKRNLLLLRDEILTVVRGDDPVKGAGPVRQAHGRSVAQGAGLRSP